MLKKENFTKQQLIEFLQQLVRESMPRADVDNYYEGLRTAIEVIETKMSDPKDGERTQKAINIALKRPDGRVENDTIYAEKMFTMDDLKNISERHDCDILVSHIGELTYFDEPTIRENTLIYERPKPEPGTVIIDPLGPDLPEQTKKKETVAHGQS